MERHPKQLHVRMFDREIESAKGLAHELGMTVSDLVRVLLQLPRMRREAGQGSSWSTARRRRGSPAR